jgi:hypothetical protein
MTKRIVLATLALAFIACAHVDPDTYQPVGGLYARSDGWYVDSSGNWQQIVNGAATGTYFTSAGALVSAVSGTAPDFTASDDLASTDDTVVGDDLSVIGLATIGETLGVTGVTTTTGGLVSTAGTNAINVITPTATNIDFTKAPQAVFVAKTTGAIMTEADTQEDLFYVGMPPRYFELFQDGNNSDNVGAWVTGATGWVIPGPNAADQGLQLTEGIVLGKAHSFTAGTTAAFRVRAAFYVPTVAHIAGLFAGFRALAAYAVADDATEIAAAYDDKAVAGILGNAGASRLMTSVATTDVSTACTHTAIIDGGLLAVEVNVSAAGLTTHNFATATPAGATAAQIRAAVTSAYAALAADTDTACDAKAVTLTAGNYVPTIMWASAAGASTVVLVDYYAGPQ